MKDDSSGSVFDKAYFDKLLEAIDARMEAKKKAPSRDRRKQNDPVIGEDRRKQDRRKGPR